MARFNASDEACDLTAISLAMNPSATGRILVNKEIISTSLTPCYKNI
jgi:hypothetical protein